MGGKRGRVEGKENGGEENGGEGEGEGEGCRYHPGNVSISTPSSSHPIDLILPLTPSRCASLRSQPIFHEGSKGYLCCKPRFLDFNDFLSHPGCRLTSTHQFFDPPAKVKVGEDGQLVEEEERVDCRVDWYQTPGGVMVSCFAKQ